MYVYVHEVNACELLFSILQQKTNTACASNLRNHHILLWIVALLLNVNKTLKTSEEKLYFFEHSLEDFFFFPIKAKLQSQEHLVFF